MSISEKLLLNCSLQGRGFNPTSLSEQILLACGGKLNPAYFQMLEMEISDTLYHLEICASVQRQMYPEASPDGKLKGWGMSDLDFEGI